ncbi:copper resistance protein CopC [Cohnella sp. CFH 77786]|uniref:copper resistance CopC/CopD family protein n=1 Tax=Cohnella sp. CFH 77786 TaxID=2662265 RepID=UPI001C609D2D|nr:copper resistance protein CopC [Cohnella sp. CFH 77786]MBW5446968.1 copper resistance protein CopC [Cohnella sp. CFH 77786]
MSKYGIVRGYSTPASARFARWIAACAAMLWLGLAGLLPTAGAHAQLVRTLPAAGDRMDASPPSVEVTFNERLDTGGYKLTVLDESSRPVTKAEPERFDEGKGLRLALPKLGEGHYTVTYSVISADGHPVSGAFVFTVGEPASLPDAGELDPHAQVGHHHGGASATDREFLVYATRIAYYAGLLGTAGLVLWSLMRNASPVVREARERLLGFAGKYTLIATLAYVAMSLMDLAQDEPLSEWLRILKDTTVGRLYAAELLLAFAAPLLAGIGAAGRVFWAAVFLGIEAWSGHAAAFSPKAYTIGLDYVHLCAASLWGGGLVLLMAVWQKERPEAGRFALAFSRWALLSFLALWVTGVLATLSYLPSLEYLRYTLWGKWLIAKIGLSVLVAVTALLIRLRLKRGDLPHGTMLKTDVGLLAAIVFVVGILTYQTPLPNNEPLHFHQMGTDMHVTLRITPNAPGDNQFILKIWLPEKDGAPKQVQLKLLPVDRPDVGAIAVPVEPYKDEEIDAYPDFAKYAYRVQGPFLPFASEWKAQIFVTDAKGNELERETTFRIY